MLTRTNKIVCDDCGKFVSYDDLAKGSASHHMINPDAYGFEETFESQCSRCMAKERMAAAQ